MNSLFCNCQTLTLVVVILFWIKSSLQKGYIPVQYSTVLSTWPSLFEVPGGYNSILRLNELKTNSKKLTLNKDNFLFCYHTFPGRKLTVNNLDRQKWYKYRITIS